MSFNIIIPYHENYSILRECIGSIFLNTRKIPFTITLVDDGSPNETFFNTITSADKQIKGIRIPEQKGFGAALNAGIKANTDPWIVFLNSDCIVRELGWLINLYESLSAAMKFKIGFVSATTNHGGNSKTIERKRTDNRNKNLIIAKEPLPIICAICPKILFDKVGLFKEYPYGWYEDEEFFFRMKKKGYKQAICEKSWVEHIGSVTVENLWKKDEKIKKIMMEDNKNKCLQDLKQMNSA